MPTRHLNPRRAFGAPLLLAATLVITGTVTSVAPVMAATRDHGSTVACRYKTVPDDAYPTYYWGGILKRIDVTPPTMYSINGANQSVAWRFTVERMRQDLYPAPPESRTTYTSPLERATASPDTRAEFTPTGVKVNLPVLSDPENYSWNDVYYSVTLKLYWFRHDGSVRKLVTVPITRYQHYEDGEYGWTEGACAGGHSIFVN